MALRARRVGFLMPPAHNFVSQISDPRAIFSLPTTFFFISPYFSAPLISPSFLTYMAVGLRAKDTHTLYIRISKSLYVILNKKWVGFFGGEGGNSRHGHVCFWSFVTRTKTLNFLPRKSRHCLELFNVVPACKLFDKVT